MKITENKRTVVDLSFDEVKRILVANSDTIESVLGPDTPLPASYAHAVHTCSKLELRPDGLTLTVDTESVRKV